ncbi:Uncharacterised protein [Mycobacteroides abscessus subsp. bolletii]|uniref:hypothetical protein n=1 Tax=Mycobacteroides abscessus TaxID=36809 RepID=UPI000925AF53|nr:hypothetical protein [Mycobacteroides abscessus]SHY75106.1 Uncharacterised protein [Mycobacteroides abscessus subsp. bolletii]SKP88524.1 Uncharacterised protein [Mycobacteroides abscessus subsp. bolletii]SKQ36825.1 Uncharacterised protein [Mycobacteroides abscessus subsp. bolletii]SKQ51943.1 Uncharacterised protein [Mycobacteroides abscessus subsp. bolletii]
MTDNQPEIPDWARDVPSAPVHREQGGGLTRPFTPQQLQEFGKGFVEQFIARVVLAVVGTLIPGVSSFDQLRNWAENLPVVGDIIRIINGLFSGIFGGIDFNNPPTPEQIWQNVVNTLIKPLNAFAELIGGLIPSWHIPGLDASKIISGKITQTFLSITNIAANIISGVLSGGNIPPLDASKVQTGKLGKDVIPNLTKDMSTDLQAVIDAGINAVRDTPNAVGQTIEGWAEALASIPTQLFNQFGGNNVPRASQEQANAAMAALVNTVNSQGAAINALQNILSDVGGFSASITFRPAETTVFTGPGTAPWTPPAWAAGGYGEYVIAPAAGGGGAGEGGSGAFGVGGYPGAWATGTFPIEAGAYSIFAGGGGLGGQDEGLGFGDNGSAGDTSTITSPTGTPVATVAGGAGGEGARRGGSGQNGKTISPQTLSAFGEAFTAGSGGTGNAGIGGVAGGGAGGNGGLFGNYTKGGTGGPAKIWMRARAPIPPQFTAMGTLILPTLKLNTGVAQTDSMTAAGQWRTIAPGGAAGGYMLIIRANASFTDYVYLRIWDVSGVTHYELGRVASGAKSAWKTGTVGAAIPFNAFTLTSDAARTFTVGVNGTAFDSYNDSGATSLMGAAYRSGGWASSDPALPGSMSQFAFLDTGTPARIVSGTVATAQGTNSTAYVDLATPGPSVTLNVPASGEVTIDVSAAYSSGGAAAQTGYMGCALSGANARAATDATAAYGRTVTAGLYGTLACRIHLTGLTPGTTTFKAVYKTSTSTATFSDRHIIVEPKP